ncbi:hypothetical protein [Streptomyces sp. NPDC007904]|uniref:hypothetical protein n=1 Tax=Streptomyces sp. NPDC007904 TaxID=3364787 RepID=UPI0036EB3FC4
MHRKTTTATLLVTVAVSALSGCVTVQRPALPGSPAAPSRASEPGPVGQTETQVVQAPAREALEMVGPSRPAKALATPSHRSAPTTAPAERKAPPGHGTGRSRAESRPGASGPTRRPPVDLPVVPEGGDGRGGADLCALGRKYGGWRPDSPEAALCEKTYGR